METNTNAEFMEMIVGFSKATKKSYEKARSDSKKEYEELIRILKSDIDNGLVREILLKKQNN